MHICLILFVIISQSIFHNTAINTKLANIKVQYCTKIPNESSIKTAHIRMTSMVMIKVVRRRLFLNVIKIIHLFAAWDHASMKVF